MPNKHATLLARKCFLTPVDAEIEALLSLKLDIDWASEGFRGQTLCETAFVSIGDAMLFNKFWKQMEIEHKVSPWSEAFSFSSQKMPFVALALKARRFDVFNDWVQHHPGTSEQWKNFALLTDIRSLALSDHWPGIAKRANFPSDVKTELETYRQENLWISSRTLAEFKKQAPVNINAHQSKVWLEQSFSSLHQLSAKEMWRIEVVLDHSNFKDWVENDWEVFWSAQPQGSTLFAPLKTTSKSFDQNTWMKFIKSFVPSKPSWTMEKVLMKEVSAFVEQANVYLKSHSSTYALNASGVVKQIDRHCRQWMNQLLPPPADRASSVSFQYGLWYAGLQYIQAPTKASPEAVALFQNVDLPSSFSDLLSMVKHAVDTDIKSSRPVWMTGGFLAMLVTTMVKGHAQNQNANLAAFVDAMSSISLKSLPAYESTNYALGLVASSLRMFQDKQASPEVIKAAQHMFWRNVFSIPSANQHYWLKKAALQPELSVVLDFWDASFAQKLDSTIDARKRTPDIATMLLKLSLQNAVGHQEDKPVKKTTRKL